MHRLDRISAKKPAKLLDSKSLTLGFSRKQIWPVFLPYPWMCASRRAHFSALGDHSAASRAGPAALTG